VSTAGSPSMNNTYPGGDANANGNYPGGVATVTFTVPKTLWPTAPPIAAYLQDGDYCGDEAAYQTPGVSFPVPNPGPGVLDG
jgi:hypothetical protein